MAPCSKCGPTRRFICPQCGGTAARGGAILAALILLGLVVWLAAKYSGKKSAASPDPITLPSQTATSTQAHAKPSPLGYANEQAQVAPQPVRPLPPSTAPGTPPGTAPANPAMQGPAVAFNPPPAPAQLPVGTAPAPFTSSFTASRDGFSNGCSPGTLTFRGTLVTFTCPSDPSKNVRVEAASVVGLDGNGILVRPSQKYHFTAKSMSKDQVVATFARWLAASRDTQ